MMPSEIKYQLSDAFKENMLQLTTEGLLFDLDEIAHESCVVKAYSIGVYDDMDDILNNWEKMKLSASKVTQMDFSKNRLTVL